MDSCRTSLQGLRSRGVGKGAPSPPPQYFENYKELVRKSILCPPPPPPISNGCSAVPALLYFWFWQHLDFVTFGRSLLLGDRYSIFTFGRSLLSVGCFSGSLLSEDHGKISARSPFSSLPAEVSQAARK